MIGLGPIAYIRPEGRISNADRLEKFQATEALLRDKIGVEHVSVKPTEQETSDMCVDVARKLFETGAVTPEDVECIVVVTQNPDGHGLPHTAAIVHGKLGLADKCAAFDISLGCSGFVYALSVIRGFMEANGMRRGLLFTADPYSKVVDTDDRNTAMLFGDGAAVALMTDAPDWRTAKFDFGTRGGAWESLRVLDDGKLFMNGRAVFQFSATEVPKSVERVLAMNELTLDDIDRFVFHQGSKYIVTAIGRRLDIQDRAAFTAGGFGNTVSSSIPIALARDLKPTDRRVLISGFGVGLSWATTVLERTGSD